MKRLVAAFLMILAAPAAFADARTEWIVTEARRLDAEVSSAQRAAASRPSFRPAPLPARLVADLERFGVEASRISVEIDRKAGAVDLRCIFRGMAEETGSQLQAASAARTGAEQSAALSRLSHMLDDAATIGPAAGQLLAGDLSVAHPIDAPLSSYARSCPRPTR
jgi:hypothetical protein